MFKEKKFRCNKYYYSAESSQNEYKKTLVESHKGIDLSTEESKQLNKNVKEYIYNTLDYEYSPCITEGINNVVKQIKHAAFGYKKFDHLKARVMLVNGFFNPIKSQ